MSFQRSNSHTVSNLSVHIVWSTKYRYPVLEGGAVKVSFNNYTNL